ncbi:glycosyltransferase [Providencia manganoxydans]|uniref:glycosyltransferase n=1 Tax=Providencia manganoxydans TaxID=2923283 RepID=UPI0034E514B3
MIKKLKVPDSEADIYKNWKYTDKVYISCVCIAYNHENYIRDALDSILAQKTEYRFELIIHDDKSTDGTREIILEYKEKFPNIVKLILQEENQYSKCPRIIPLTAPYLDGNYVTICEGDDFWIDENKINLQYSALTENNNIDICFTSALTLDPHGNTAKISYFDDRNKKYFDLNHVIKGGGGFMPTASIMVNKKILTELPKWYFDAPVGDYFLQIFSSISNGAIYIPSISCVYRINAINSWSNQRKNLNKVAILNEANMYEKCLYELLKYGVSSETINYAIAQQYITLSLLLIYKNNFSEAKRFILKSWKLAPKINKKQIIIYYFRNILPLLKMILSIKKLSSI